MNKLHETLCITIFMMIQYIHKQTAL